MSCCLTLPFFSIRASKTSTKLCCFYYLNWPARLWSWSNIAARQTLFTSTDTASMCIYLWVNIFSFQFSLNTSFTINVQMWNVCWPLLCCCFSPCLFLANTDWWQQSVCAEKWHSTKITSHIRCDRSDSGYIARDKIWIRSRTIYSMEVAQTR